MILFFIKLGLIFKHIQLASFYVKGEDGTKETASRFAVKVLGKYRGIFYLNIQSAVLQCFHFS